VVDPDFSVILDSHSNSCGGGGGHMSSKIIVAITVSVAVAVLIIAVGILVGMRYFNILYSTKVTASVSPAEMKEFMKKHNL